MAKKKPPPARKWDGAAARLARGRARLPSGFVPRAVRDDLDALVTALQTTGEAKGALSAVAVALREACERRGI